VELWARKCSVILPKFRLQLKCRDLLHAANLRHGTDGFTSLLKEGMLRIFFALKIRYGHIERMQETRMVKSNTLLETNFKEANRKTKDTLGG